MATNVLGFDIGSFSIKIVKYNGTSIQRAAEIVLPDDLVKDGCIISYDGMADLIKSILKRKKLGGGNAAVILPSSLAILRRFEMPLMTEEQLDLNLPYEFHDFLDMDKDMYFYDYALNKIADSKMDITAAAVPKEVIANYREMFKRAGLKLVTAIPEECAYANLLRNAKVADDYECCFIDLGDSSIDVNIFEGTVFQSGHSNEIAMSALVNKVAEEFSLENDDAHQYVEKNEIGVQETESSMQIYSAISADLRKALNFYKFSNRDSELNIAYCFGGGFLVPGLMNSILTATSFDLRNAKDILPAFTEKVDYPGNFALAIGAVLQ